MVNGTNRRPVPGAGEPCNFPISPAPLAPARLGSNSRSADAPTARRSLSRRTFLGLTLAITALSILINLRPLLWDTRPLDDHEIFVAQTAREMIRTGDWIIPQFNGAARLRKPPLMYYAVVGVAEIFPGARGVPPWAARLPSVLSGAVLLACVAGIGALIYDRRTGLLAAILTLTCLGFFDYINSARPEMLYAASCAMLTLGLAGAWASTDRTRPQLLWSLTTWLGFALACLSKGPHLPLLILAGVASGMAFTGERKRIPSVVRPVMGLTITLVLVGSWAAAVLIARPDALSIWNHELLGLSASENANLADHLSPYYLYSTPALALPWAIPFILGLFVTFEKDRPDLRRGRTLFWVLALVAVVMSIATHRRAYYMVPILPVIAVLAARGAIDALEKLAAHPRHRPLLRILAALHAIAAVVTFAIIMWRSLPDRVMVAGLIAGGMLAAVSFVIIGRTRLVSPKPHTLIIAAALPWLIMPCTSDAPGWWGARRYELWSFSQDAARHIAPADTVYTIDGIRSTLVYILDRPLTPVATLDDIPVPAPGERVWAVGTPSDFKHPPPTLATRKALQISPRGSDPGERTILLSITRTPPAAPATATPTTPPPGEPPPT